MTSETLIVGQSFCSLDLLLWRRYGRAIAGLVERTLEINPRLAAQGPILALGTRVTVEIPAPAAPRAVPVISLWD